jgi:hypothetical protein
MSPTPSVNLSIDVCAWGPGRGGVGGRGRVGTARMGVLWLTSAIMCRDVCRA